MPPFIINFWERQSAMLTSARCLGASDIQTNCCDEFPPPIGITRSDAVASESINHIGTGDSSSGSLSVKNIWGFRLEWKYTGNSVQISLWMWDWICYWHVTPRLLLSCHVYIWRWMVSKSMDLGSRWLSGISNSTIQNQFSDAEYLK